nr:MAG TPA: hypothetical protein [Caudoviricetes sp.]
MLFFPRLSQTPEISAPCANSRRLKNTLVHSLHNAAAHVKTPSKRRQKRAKNLPKRARAIPAPL